MRVGVILQRAILILLLACFPCWAILINTESILLAVKQEEDVARSAGEYMLYFWEEGGTFLLILMKNVSVGWLSCM